MQLYIILCVFYLDTFLGIYYMKCFFDFQFMHDLIFAVRRICGFHQRPLHFGYLEDPSSKRSPSGWIPCDDVCGHGFLSCYRIGGPWLMVIPMSTSTFTNTRWLFDFYSWSANLCLMVVNFHPVKKTKISYHRERIFPVGLHGTPLQVDQPAWSPRRHYWARANGATNNGKLLIIVSPIRAMGN